MKRRRFFQTAAGIPVAAGVAFGQGPAGQQQPAEYPKIDSSGAEQAAEGVQRFFGAAQFTALTRLSDILVPKTDTSPGAVEAGVPLFLDFLIGKSPADRQMTYTKGLDLLNKHAATKYKKPFADLTATEATPLLDPLKKPWTYPTPPDPLENFLRTAKADVRTAAMNSREYAMASSNSGGRRQSGMGMYWHPLD